MLIWKDKVKSYNDDTVASSETRAGEFKLSIHRHVHYAPDVWLGSCGYIFSQSELKSKDVQGAKAEAESKLRLVLEKALSDLDKDAAWSLPEGVVDEINVYCVVNSATGCKVRGEHLVNCEEDQYDLVDGFEWRIFKLAEA
jgi:hypothetical protein